MTGSTVTPRSPELADARGDARVLPHLVDEVALEQDAVLGVEVERGARGQVVVLEQAQHALDPEVQNPALALARSLVELPTQRGRWAMLRMRAIGEASAAAAATRP